MRGFRHTLLLIGLLLGAHAHAGGPASWFGKYQPQVVVSDPYIEMHTGPGKGYPIFYVAGQGDEITILKRRTSWFKVRLLRGSHQIREGWVNIEQIRHTLDLDGNAIEFPSYGIEDFTQRRWVAGLGGGDLDGANTVTGFLGFHLNPYISLQAEASQILGDYSDGWMVNGGIYMHPFPNWRISPFVTIGTGYIHMEPQTTIVQAEDLDDEVANAGAGANIYISDRFILRLMYKRLTVYTSRDDNEELNQWNAGFSLFF